MRILILAVMAVFFVACSSKTVKDDEGASEKPAPTPPKPAVKREAPPPPRKETPAPKPEGTYAALTEAIRNQSEEGIFNAATAILMNNSSDLKALNAMANYHFRKKQYGASRLFLSRAMKVNPNYGSLYNNMALVDLATNDRKEAIANLKKAIELNSNDPVASANLGSLYALNRDYPKAQFPLELAYRGNQKGYGVLNNYGIALVANGKASQAKPIYQDALKQQATSREVLFNYVVLLVDHLNQGTEAQEYINRLNFTGVPPESRNRLNSLENKAKGK